MQSQRRRIPRMNGQGRDPHQKKSRRVCIEPRDWRGDPLVQELKPAAQALLFQLHMLAFDRGTWPYISSDPVRVAKQIRWSVRPVENGLDAFASQDPPLVMPVAGDNARLELRRLDGLFPDPNT